MAIKEAEIVQLRDKLPERRSVPEQPEKESKAPQSYYFESLMLQNDQI